jgi:hypothetical protein
MEMLAFCEAASCAVVAWVDTPTLTFTWSGRMEVDACP